MRGGITLDQVYMTDSEERQIISKIIEQNLELTQKTKIAFV